MSPRPFAVELGPFTGGLVNEREAQWLKPDEAQDAQNLEVISGAINGSLKHVQKAPSSAPGAHDGFLTLDDCVTVKGEAGQHYYVLDNGVVYSLGVNGYPGVYKLSGSTYTIKTLGIPWVTGLTYAGLPATKPAQPVGPYVTNVSFAVSYFTSKTNDDIKSNPLRGYSIGRFGYIDGTTLQNAFSLTGLSTPSDDRIAGIDIWLAEGESTVGALKYHAARIVVGTLAAGDSSLPIAGSVTSWAALSLLTFYFDSTFINTNGDNVGAWKITHANGDITCSIDTNQKLRWRSDGYPDIGDDNRTVETTYTQDHTPASEYNFTLMANAIHTNVEVGRPGGGILYTADTSNGGRRLRWCMAGYFHNWPTKYYVDLADSIKAIVTHAGYTLVFTPTRTYQISGINEAMPDLSQVSIGHHIRANAGRSAVWTPHGIIYLAREGLALTNGQNSVIISKGKIKKSYWDGLTLYAAAYYLDKYILFAAIGTTPTNIVVDLRDGPENARFTVDTSLLVKSVFTTDRLYVSDGTNIYEWGAATDTEIAGVAASKIVGSGNAAITYTAKSAGVAGNGIRITHAASVAASVSVSGNDITTYIGGLWDATWASGFDGTAIGVATLSSLTPPVTAATYELAVTVTPGQSPSESVVWMDWVSDRTRTSNPESFTGQDGLYDRHLRLTIMFPSSATVSAVEARIAGWPGPIWSSQIASALLDTCVPMAVFKGDTQLNPGGESLGTFVPGTYIFDLYLDRRNENEVPLVVDIYADIYGGGVRTIDVTGNTYTYGQGPPQGNYQGTQPVSAAQYRYRWHQTEESAPHVWSTSPISITSLVAGTLSFTPGTAPTQGATSQVVVVGTGTISASDAAARVNSDSAASALVTAAAAGAGIVSTQALINLANGADSSSGRNTWLWKTGQFRTNGGLLIARRMRVISDGQVEVQWVSDTGGVSVIRTLSVSSKTETTIRLPASRRGRHAGLNFVGVKHGTTGKVGVLHQVRLEGEVFDSLSSGDNKDA